MNLLLMIVLLIIAYCLLVVIVIFSGKAINKKYDRLFEQEIRYRANHLNDLTDFDASFGSAQDEVRKAGV